MAAHGDLEIMEKQYNFDIMDKVDKIAGKLSDILPERPKVSGFDSTRNSLDTSSRVNEEAAKIKAKQDAKEIAKIKAREKAKLKRLEDKELKYQQAAKELGLDAIPEGQTIHQAQQLTEQREKIKALELIEDHATQPLHPTELAKMIPDKKTYSSVVNRALQMQGATRPEILKLLTSLNINLNLQLSKQDTANLLACLLTCNESQLMSLYNNKKIPVVIKTVIKRILEDSKLGNIETVEKLWDRIFGKNAMVSTVPEQTQLETGVIPNVPVSREAYVLIRDTLIK